MKNLLLIFQLATSLLPLVKDFIISVEAAIPVSGQGIAKMQMVKDMTEAAFKAVSNVETSFKQVWPSVQVLVNGLVAIYNATGIFNKGK